MATKRKAATRVKNDLSTDPAKKSQPISDQRAIEKVSSDMTRLFSEQSFETLEEANNFIQQFVGTRDLPRPERELTPVERAQDKMYVAW
ncbi:MAG: hypothetical protein H0W99_12840, partial [Acidobacteria bacterium]|nr:hypothetical protein [Acidobacteriota bacterium]